MPRFSVRFLILALTVASVLFAVGVQFPDPCYFASLQLPTLLLIVLVARRDSQPSTTTAALAAVAFTGWLLAPWRRVSWAPGRPNSWDLLVLHFENEALIPLLAVVAAVIFGWFGKQLAKLWHN